MKASDTPDALPPEQSSVVPALGITFVEALARWVKLRAEEQAAKAAGEDEEAFALYVEYGGIPEALVDTEPQTAGDALVMLEILGDPDAGREVGCEQQVCLAIRRAHDLLRELAALPSSDPSDAQLGAILADTVSSFEVEARTVCMPLSPSLKMVDAGAAVVGITTEQAEAVYAAMAAAYLQEIAA